MSPAGDFSCPPHVKKRIGPPFFIRVCALIRFKPHVLVKAHGLESLRHKAPDFGDAFGRQEGMSGSYGSLPKGGEFSNEFVLAFSDFPDCDIGRVHGL